MSRLDTLRKEFNQAREGITKIEAAATADGERELTDAEQADVDRLYARAEELTPEIEREGARHGRMTAAADVLTRIGVTAGAAAPSTHNRAAPSAEIITPGAWLAAAIRTKQGDARPADELLLRTVATMTTADTPGIIPVPIIGPVIKLADSLRPVFASFTPRPMPAAGKTFSRPTITQRVNVAQQAAELDELASRKMTLAGNTVTKMTLGGVLELSEQDIDWTDPAILDIVVQDFVDYYSEITEAKAIAALGTLASATSDYDDTSIATIITSIMGGVQAVYTSAKRMPDTVWMAIDAMFALAGTTNSTTNVSALSLVKQALTDAGVPLNFVTAPGLASGTIIVGSSSLVESYEQRKGILSAPDVSHLGVNIAYRGYAAFFGLAAGFVKLVAA